MKIEIEIPDEELAECIKKMVAQRLTNDFSYDRNLYKNEIAQAIRDVIYAEDRKSVV